MNTAKLYCITMGATVPGRLIEQHDVMFAAAADISDLIPSLQAACMVLFADANNIGTDATEFGFDVFITTV